MKYPSTRIQLRWNYIKFCSSSIDRFVSIILKINIVQCSSPALHPHTYLNRRENHEKWPASNLQKSIPSLSNTGRDTIIAAVVTSTMLVRFWKIGSCVISCRPPIAKQELARYTLITEFGNGKSVILISERSRFRGRK